MSCTAGVIAALALGPPALPGEPHLEKQKQISPAGAGRKTAYDPSWHPLR